MKAGIKDHVYKVGDRIKITKIMVKSMKGFIAASDADAWLGKVGVVYIQRWNREKGQVCINWGDNKRTNTFLMRGIGLKFEKPRVAKLSIMDAPESILSPSEKIIKGLMEGSGSPTEKQARGLLEIIMPAMTKRGIVFTIC